MKAIKYFLYALIATFVFAGCSDDPTYTRGESEADGCYGVYFPSQDNAGRSDGTDLHGHAYQRRRCHHGSRNRYGQ